MPEREGDYTEDVEDLQERVVGKLVMNGIPYPIRHADHIPIKELLSIHARDDVDRPLHEFYWRRLRILSPDLPEEVPAKTSVAALKRWLQRAGVLSPPAEDAAEPGSSSSASSPSTGT